LQGKQSFSLHLALIEFLTGGFNPDFCGDSALDNITTVSAGRRLIRPSLAESRIPQWSGDHNTKISSEGV